MMSAKKKLSMQVCAVVVSVAGALAPSLARADVVVTGNNPPPAQPAPVVVQPQQPATNTTVVQPVESAPAPTRHTTVVERENRNYMSTIAISALMGGLAGVLVGGALYFLVDDQDHAPRIGYWAAGGVLVGTGVGLAQVMVQESRASRAVASMPTDPAPTFRLALFRAQF
jgi:hypothetical protein